MRCAHLFRHCRLSDTRCSRQARLAQSAGVRTQHRPFELNSEGADRCSPCTISESRSPNESSGYARSSNCPID